MREILFRGKTENGDWAEGNLLVYPDVNRAYIQKGDYFKGGAVEVKRSTVGQYTGKTDKNKKNVFDGDIIRMFNAKPPFDVGVVQWDDHDQCYVVRSTWSEKCHLTDFGNLGRSEYFEIIRNIYDNPELLKGGDT